MSDTSCIIVHYKELDATLETLASLAPSVSDGQHDVIVIDNESNENSAEAFQNFSTYPLGVISTATNLGFAGGLNLGIKQALERGVQYIWVLNNDTLVEPDCARFLRETAEATNAGIVGNLILYYPDKERIWFAGGRILWPWLIVRHMQKPRKLSSIALAPEPREVSFVTGCSMFIRREVFERIGMFDETLFLYAEDLDFCIRAKRAGFRLLFEPRARLWHKVSLGSGGEYNPLREYYMARNSFVMIRRYVSGTLFQAPILATRFLWDLLRCARSLVKTNRSPVGAGPLIYRALTDFRRGDLGKLEDESVLAMSVTR